MSNTFIEGKTALDHIKVAIETIKTAMQAAGIPITGTVAIDQTTPGTTNGVSITNASIAGTAGTPNANVISVQGITGGTTLPVTEASASAIKTAVEAIQSTAGVKKITDALPAGTNTLGLIKITDDGTDVASIEVPATYYPGITGVEKGIRAIALAHQMWSNSHPANSGAGADENFYPQQMDIEGNLLSDISMLRGNIINLGTGNVSTGTLRVTIADNSTGVVGLNAGTNAIGKLAANSGVDIGDVDVTSVVAGTGATNLGKAEDAAHSSGDTGVMALAIRDDTLGATSGAENDYEPLHTNARGALWTQEDVLPLATNVSSTFTLTSASTAYQITEPTSAFMVVYCNNSDTDMYWGFATLTTGGILLSKNGGIVSMMCAANASPFFYCASAGKVLNYTTTVI